MSTQNVHLLPVSGLPLGCVVSVLPAALRRPQKKHALDFWSMYLMFLLSFLTISGSGTRGDLRSVRGGNQEQG